MPSRNPGTKQFKIGELADSPPSRQAEPARRGESLVTVQPDPAVPVGRVLRESVVVEQSVLAGKMGWTRWKEPNYLPDQLPLERAVTIARGQTYPGSQCRIVVTYADAGASPDESEGGDAACDN